MICFVLIISFLLESIISTFISYSSVLCPLFLLTSLVIVYPYFKNNIKNFAFVSLICGIIYDIVFFNTCFINTLSFILCSGVIILGYNFINYNIYSSNFLNIIILVLYRVSSYFSLIIVDYLKFNGKILLKGIYSSILLNIIYGVILFLLIDLLKRKYRIKRLE